ncbi:MULTISPECIES: hypothetical protein [Dietzia]|uniref:hypothetical protein n=1 Tax=Dietzia TaxID=37914 RepID=UPI0019D220A6|nr:MULTISPECIES: hypothetical protein [unclassified Dietzia]
MIDNFLRPAETGAQRVADALRLLGVLSVLLALLFHELTDAAIVAFTLPALMLPRFIGMRAWADISVSTALLVAAWSNVVDLYRVLRWWDVPVHVVLAGWMAVVAYLFLAHRGIVRSPDARGFTTAGGIVLTTVLGLALGALWEMVEWFGYAFLTDDIYVTYGDTVGDMAAGGLGALVAGVLMARGPQLLTPTALRTRESSETTSSR